jgi:hypothetical protein
MMNNVRKTIGWIRKIPENIRLLIMEYLDARHPEYCRAELVMWALGYHTIKETFFEGGCLSQSCRGKNPYDVYCGKCARTGRLYRQESPVQ